MNLLPESCQTFFRILPEATILVDQYFQFTAANAAFEKLIGGNALEFSRLTLKDLFIFSKPDEMAEVLNNLKKLDQSPLRWECRLLHKSGVFITVAVSARRWSPKSGDDEVYCLQLHDLTDLKIKEDQLQRILDNTYDGYWDLRVGTDNMYLSPRMWQMLGIDHTQMPHSMSKIHEYVYPEDIKLIHQAFNEHVQSKGEKPYSIELRYTHASGNTMWVQCKGKVIEWDDQGNPVRMIGTHSDITPIKNAQQTIIQKSKMAALGEMAGGIAHEINNPLAIIQATCDSIRLQLEVGKQIQPEHFLNKVDRITNTVQRISLIINGLRMYSRDSDKINPKPESLLSIIHSTLALCGEKLKNLGVDCQIDVPEHLMISCNKIQISQVILNLISNSFYAIKENEDKWIRIRAFNEKGQVKVVFQDSGLGIDKDIVNKIMEPLFSTKPVGEGTGLGLSISKGIIETHGGKIEYDPENQNTTFVIVLPAIDPSESLSAEFPA